MSSMGVDVGVSHECVHGWGQLLGHRWCPAWGQAQGMGVSTRYCQQFLVVTDPWDKDGALHGAKRRAWV
eukprot:1148080-Pelagomonas_calceolata.AAC.3